MNRSACVLAFVSLLLSGCEADRDTVSTVAPASATPNAQASGEARASDSPTVDVPSRSATPSGPSVYVYPITGCASRYGTTHHNYEATDIFARRGCSVVSVTSGRVDEVTRVDRWSSKQDDGAKRGGLSVSVIGVDGVRYYYSHFATLTAAVQPGRLIEAGTQLGTVGTTGSAKGTSPHVHFGLSWPTAPNVWWVRRGMVQPAPFLDAWKQGRPVSPAATTAALRSETGDLPRCRSRC